MPSLRGCFKPEATVMRCCFGSGTVVVTALFASVVVAGDSSAQSCPSFPNGPYIWGGGSHHALATADAS
jgi:hypothetical protein